jgi:hypothetical protein
VTVDPNKPASVDVPLVANAIVVGSLVDGDGKPLAGIPVALIDDHGDGKMRVEMSGPPPRSGPDGKFRLEHSAGKVIFLVLSGGGRPTQRPITLEAGKTVDLGTVKVDLAPPSSERRVGEQSGTSASL